ncbi:MAG: 2-oxoacid:acceptor oxidoreductase family protein [Candidatus Geothermarchaeales archaeon]
MWKEIIIVGRGGHGVKTMGDILSTAALHDGRRVSHWPTYGAAARGGPSISQIIISSRRIDYPRCTAADVLVAMDEELLGRYVGYLKPRGMLIADSSLVKRLPRDDIINVKWVPAARIAQDMGSRILINMVMLGALFKTTKLISEDAVVEAIKSIIPSSAQGINLEAFRRGAQIS